MSDDELQRMLAAASAEFRAGLPVRIAAIDTLWHQIRSGENAAQGMQDMIRAVHALAGSAGTFGCAAVGDAAVAAETVLEPHRDTGLPPEAARAEIALRLDALRQAAAAAGRG